MKFRISWKIGFATGHGRWHTDDDYNMLKASVVTANMAHGGGTHWVEFG